MSATLNATAFSKYYNDCPSLNIPGFTYPVEELYMEDIYTLNRFVQVTCIVAYVYLCKKLFMFFFIDLDIFLKNQFKDSVKLSQEIRFMSLLCLM